ncbi:MAG: hypothetical protein WCG51_06340, partial [Elusimicrobiota bacterium]
MGTVTQSQKGQTVPETGVVCKEFADAAFLSIKDARRVPRFSGMDATLLLVQPLQGGKISSNVVPHEMILVTYVDAQGKTVAVVDNTVIYAKRVDNPAPANVQLETMNVAYDPGLGRHAVLDDAVRDYPDLFRGLEQIFSDINKALPGMSSAMRISMMDTIAKLNALLGRFPDIFLAALGVIEQLRQNGAPEILGILAVFIVFRLASALAISLTHTVSLILQRIRRSPFKDKPTAARGLIFRVPSIDVSHFSWSLFADHGRIDHLSGNFAWGWAGLGASITEIGINNPNQLFVYFTKLGGANIVHRVQPVFKESPVQLRALIPDGDDLFIVGSPSDLSGDNAPVVICHYVYDQPVGVLRLENTKICSPESGRIDRWSLEEFRGETFIKIESSDLKGRFSGTCSISYRSLNGEILGSRTSSRLMRWTLGIFSHRVLKASPVVQKSDGTFKQVLADLSGFTYFRYLRENGIPAGVAVIAAISLPVALSVWLFIFTGAGPVVSIVAGLVFVYGVSKISAQLSRARMLYSRQLSGVNPRWMVLVSVVAGTALLWAARSTLAPVAMIIGSLLVIVIAASGITISAVSLMKPSTPAQLSGGDAARSRKAFIIAWVVTALFVVIDILRFSYLSTVLSSIAGVFGVSLLASSPASIVMVFFTALMMPLALYRLLSRRERTNGIAQTVSPLGLRVPSSVRRDSAQSLLASMALDRDYGPDHRDFVDDALADPVAGSIFRLKSSDWPRWSLAGLYLPENTNPFSLSAPSGRADG